MIENEDDEVDRLINLADGFIRIWPANFIYFLTALLEAISIDIDLSLSTTERRFQRLPEPYPDSSADMIWFKC